MLNQTLLIVDADTLIRSSLKAFLENHNYKVCEAGTLEDAVKHDLSAYAAIVCDDQLIDILNLSSDTPVIVTSAQASLRSAVSAMKLGAADYLAKPYDMNELASTIESLTEHLDIQPAIKLLGSCRGIESLKDDLDKVAPTDSTVLIEGESGTGKELVARKIHSLSSRADRQMISLNCAAIPAQQIESELFGYESGSVTDVNNQKSGLVEAADGTTLFLDEIGELPMDAQARLLRVIEDGELRRVGSIETKRVSIRLIASTHRNLQTLTEQGAFREDLYFRLNVVRFKLPPLRERGDDVVALAGAWLTCTDQALGTIINAFTLGDTQQILTGVITVWIVEQGVTIHVRGTTPHTEELLILCTCWSVCTLHIAELTDRTGIVITTSWTTTVTILALLTNVAKGAIIVGTTRRLDHAELLVGITDVILTIIHIACIDGTVAIIIAASCRHAARHLTALVTGFEVWHTTCAQTSRSITLVAKGVTHLAV